MTKRAKYFLTLDVGTTSVKITIFDLFGRIIGTSLKEYTLNTPSQNIVELNPEVYWECGKEGLIEVIKKAQVPREDIVSIGVCSQGETLILLDNHGKPLRNAIVWMDNRSIEEAAELKSKLGVIKCTGQPDVYPTWTATKILWLKKNEPSVFSKVQKFLLVEDFMIYKLSGEFAGEFSLYPSSYMLDIVNKKWLPEVLSFLEVRSEQLVTLGESGRIVGTLSSDVAAELNLLKQTCVISGAMDMTASLLGSGCISPGTVTEITGAAEVFCQTLEKYPSNIDTSMAIQYHAIPNNYILVGWCNSGGMTLKWLRDTFFSIENEIAEKKGIDSYKQLTQMAETIPIGCEGLTFFPYIAGAGTLPVNPDVRGIFWGIEMNHTRAHFIRSVMESLAFVLRNGLEEMSLCGAAYSDIRIIGGGAKSDLWNRIKADILGTIITTMECPEAASLGTAILQSISAGYYSSYQEAVDNMVRTAQIVEPEPNNRAAANEAYSRFTELEKQHLRKTN
jgi:sugar (pentulose or hexulose) kinase